MQINGYSRIYERVNVHAPVDWPRDIAASVPAIDAKCCCSLRTLRTCVVVEFARKSLQKKCPGFTLAVSIQMELLGWGLSRLNGIVWMGIESFDRV